MSSRPARARRRGARPRQPRKGKPENVAAGAELHEADIRDPDAVFDAVRPETVFHLAAQADVRVSVERPDHDAEVNVLGTLRILEAARRHDAQIVFSSTGGAIYGECDGPAAETAERRPLAPYGTSKLCGEEYLATWNRLYGTGHVSLRFGNVYGPRQEPHGEAGVVAIFMGRLRDGGTPTIYGDGSQTRDYVFVGDVVRAMLAAAGHDGGVFNVGTGGRPPSSSSMTRSSAPRGASVPELARGAARRAAAERARQLARRARARLAPAALARRRARGDVEVDQEGWRSAGRTLSVRAAGPLLPVVLALARCDARRRRRRARSS